MREAHVLEVEVFRECVYESSWVVLVNVLFEGFWK
jgi:hypothetical protein